MSDEPDIIENTREFTPRLRALAALLCCGMVAGLLGFVLGRGISGPDVALAGLMPPESSAPMSSSEGPANDSPVPAPLATDACGCPGTVPLGGVASFPPQQPTLDPTTLASASYPQSETRVGPATPGTDWALQGETVWPQILIAGPNAAAYQPAPVDADGSPVFPTAQLGEIQAVRWAPGGTAFVYVTLTSRPATAGEEQEVAHVRIFDRAGDYSVTPSNFGFSPAGDRRLIEPETIDGSDPKALRAGTLQPGQSASGDLVFDVPPGGGDLFLTQWLPGMAPSSLPSKPGAQAVAIGPMFGPWHIGT